MREFIDWWVIGFVAGWSLPCLLILWRYRRLWL
jgi:hypothetical protein